MAFLIIITLFMVVLTFCFVFPKGNRKSQKAPGPKGLPFFGVAFQLSTESMHLEVEKYVDKFGEILQLDVMGKSMVVLNSERMIHKAFVETDAKFAMNDRPEMLLHRFFPDGSILLSQNGFCTEHSQLRKAFTKGFHVYGDGIKVFEETVQKAIGNLVKTIDSFKGQEFDCLSVVKHSIISLISVLLSGEELHPSDRRFKAIWNYVDAVGALNNAKTHTILAYVPFARHFGVYKDVHDNICNGLAVICEEYFTKMKATYAEGNIRGMVDFLIAEQLQEAKTGEEVVFTDERLKGVAADIVLAGVTTTVSSLASMLLCVINHPEVQQRVQAEIHEVIGKARLPTLGDKAKCPYTEAVFLETQRYITIAPLGGAHSCKEHICFEGYDIPAKAYIFYNLWHVNHDEKIWGDPWKFRPERFLDKHGQLLPRTHTLRKNWMSFGAGRRQCIGEPFARSRIFLYFTTLLQKWRFVPVRNKCGSCDPRSEQFDSRGTIIPKPFFCQVYENHL